MRTSEGNRDTGAAWRYHESTKHSYESLRSTRHVLDWSNQPIPYKIYPTLEPIPLPTEFPPSSLPSLAAIRRSAEPVSGEQTPNVNQLARICYFSNGITRRLRRPGGEMAFRSAACTGALYHVELYLVCGHLPGLEAGVYHFGAHDNGLRQLRKGDFRAVLARATGDEESVASAPATIACTSTFWRNAWKYQARAYRHSFWDSGTILANLLATAAAQELPASVAMGFADDDISRLLDVDPEKEAAISLVSLGRTNERPPPAPPLEPLDLATAPLSATEVVYPEIVQAHAASCLQSGQEAAEWRSSPPARQLASPSGPLFPLKPLQGSHLPNEPIEVVIKRRGSSRRFARTPLSLEQLSTLLDTCLSDVPSDTLGDLADAYLVVDEVDGLAAGAYVLHRQRRALEQLKQASNVRDLAGWLALGQALGTDAAVNVYFLADLRAVLERLGNRGYRAAQLEAAILAGRLYLGAYALGLGATGLTFFDDDVTRFFSPHAAGKSVMFLLALGNPLGRTEG